ncbi:MAG: hypothetical protein ACPGTG_07335, partial [Flavobacteriales bacterium]
SKDKDTIFHNSFFIFNATQHTYIPIVDISHIIPSLKYNTFQQAIQKKIHKSTLKTNPLAQKKHKYTYSIS